MAQRRIGGKTGSVSFSGSILTAIDFASWTLRFSHPTDDDSAYGDSGNGSSHAGSGTVDYNLNCAGFGKEGTTLTTTAGFSSTTAYETPSTATLTLATGSTISGSYLLSGGAIEHAKRRGAIPFNYDGVNDGSMTETIATT